MLHWFAVYHRAWNTCSYGGQPWFSLAGVPESVLYRLHQWRLLTLLPPSCSALSLARRRRPILCRRPRRACLTRHGCRVPASSTASTATRLAGPHITASVASLARWIGEACACGCSGCTLTLRMRRWSALLAVLFAAGTVSAMDPFFVPAAACSLLLLATTTPAALCKLFLQHANVTTQHSLSKQR
jgi:hypothetical protein